MGSLSEELRYFPNEFAARIQKFQQSYNNLPALLDAQGLKANDKQWFLHSIIYK